MGSTQAYKRKTVKRVKVFLSLLVLVIVQANGAFASGCMMAMQVGGTMFPSTLYKDSGDGNTQTAFAQYNDLPPCHQQQETLSDLPTSQMDSFLSDTYTDCCAEHCACIIGGCNSMAFVPPQFHANFVQTSNQAMSLSPNNLVSILVQNLFRPPIFSFLG
ncbi:hypothetical protein FKG94_17560 [Exilibacterium tricleocarpae]|uniref:CopL family metal-binding regulatory protein n=1 Tax=Exilibacterium tricleocarpae TaxID=2591008 RepID=A0A545T8G3_9GAMM|nr:hypothetical protein [Exilibacterium tricleocarpae]TQV73504.1 hypothetical protein FKG94_17560 [Exilibacterium tricleocarpae]